MKTEIIDIKLSDLESLTETLRTRLELSQFEPDVVVYLETGARLLAFHFHKLTGTAAASLTIQRPGSSLKVRIVPILSALPQFLQNLLRQTERQFASRGANKRKILHASQIDLFKKKVLILDDAADSGQSLLLAKQWVLKKGGTEGNIKLATIAVTQPRAKEIVDFWIYHQLCRFPWSSDSIEREECLRLYAQIDPAKLATSSF
jgi:phosphoribosylpyrophosphate synthetase